MLNYMLYVRGNKHDYQHWEEDGNPGWGYDEVRTHRMFSRILDLQLLFRERCCHFGQNDNLMPITA